MNDLDWVKEFPVAVVVCDVDGVILGMNDKAARAYEAVGGHKLVGSNVLDCHPEPARTKTECLLDAREKNVYTVEKNGRKKLIFQAPWYRNGQYAGFVELSFEISFDSIPHYIRS